MGKQELIEAVAQVRKRLTWFRTWRFSLAGLVLGATVACAIAAVGLMLPIAYYRYAAGATVVAGWMLAFALAVWRRPSEREAASAIDKAGGLDEQVATALAHAESPTPIAAIQRAQAAEEAEAFARNVRQRLPWPLERKRLSIAALLLVVLVGLLLLPNPMDEVVAAREQAAQWLEDQIESVEQMKEELKSLELPPLQREALEQKLERLEEGLLASETAAEALEEMERALLALQEQEEQLTQERKEAEQWLDRMAASPALKDLAQSMAGDRGQLDEAMSGLGQQVARLTPEQKQQLAEMLEQLAESAGQSDEEQLAELKSVLEQAAQEAGGPGELSAETIQQMSEALASLQLSMASSAQASQQLAAMGSQMAAAGMQAAQQLAASGVSVSPAWGANGLAAGMAAGGQPGGAGTTGQTPGQGAPGAGGTAGQPGSGSGTGSGSGSGAGSGSGSGSGTGSGSGSGSGSGTGTGGGSGTGGGTGAGKGEGSRGLVSTPRTPIGGGNPESDGGPLSGSGGELSQGGSAPALDGASRPYEDVYAEYETEASRSLNRSQLPQTMQQLVRDYFTEIQPNR